MGRVLVTALVAVSVIAFNQIAFAADLPVKASGPPAAVPITYNWTGIYIGGAAGYQWANVQDVADPTGFTEDSKAKGGIVSGLIGAQYQFNVLPWGGLVLGVEASANEAIKNNNTGNFGFCANPAFLCGLKRLDHLNTVGGRLGLAVDRWLFTISGGWASAEFERTDFLPTTGRFGSGGGNSSERHNGDYFGAGFEYMIYSSGLTDIIAGIDYQHIWLHAKSDIDVNQVGHTLSANDNIVRGRVTVKFNPWR